MAWGPAEEDLKHVDVNIALIPWDRLDELHSRAAVHQQPEPPVPRRGEGLPLVALYGTAGKMAPTIAWLQEEGFAGIRPTRRAEGAPSRAGVVDRFPNLRSAGSRLALQSAGSAPGRVPAAARTLS